MKVWKQFEFKSAAGRGCSPSQLARFESLIGARLPDDYREFLLEVNGGKPIARSLQFGDYAAVKIEWEGREPQETDEQAIVRYLLVVEDWANIFEEGRSDALTVFWAYETFVKEQQSLPAGLVPIGRDPGGSLFLIDVAGRQPGAVLFWASDWYDFEEQSDPYHNVGFVAATFSEFLDKITFES